VLTRLIHLGNLFEQEIPEDQVTDANLPVSFRQTPLGLREAEFYGPGRPRVANAAAAAVQIALEDAK
jgi:hypothetical protein